MLDFWKRVKKLVVGDFTQAWLCDEADISTGTLSGWINKNRIPPADKAQKIADALGVTVEYLVTGKEPYSDEVASRLPNASNVETPYKTPVAMRQPTNTLVAVPYFTDQTVSAGKGDTVIETDSGDVIHIEGSWLTTAQRDRLAALQVQGDSMVGEKITHNDVVIYERGRIEENGIYVITIDGKAYVKRLEFNPIEKKVYIHSANERYKTMVIDADYPDYKVEGKVELWIHRNKD